MTLKQPTWNDLVKVPESPIERPDVKSAMTDLMLEVANSSNKPIGVVTIFLPNRMPLVAPQIHWHRVPTRSGIDAFAMCWADTDN